MPTLRFKPINRFYDELVTFLAMVSGFAVGIDAQRGLSGAKAEPEQPAVFVGYRLNESLRFHPSQILTPMIRDEWPAEITFQTEPGRIRPEDEMFHHTRFRAHKRLRDALMQAVFLRFFETLRQSVEAKHGKPEKGSWPPSWYFGWVLRNAFAHGGTIHWKDSSLPTATWHSITYSYTDNGTPILDKDIGPVEVILLMADMDGEAPH